ncbi:hypothetical protein ASG76_03250 [Nocardioides sp. Soil774]|uniref:DUF3105 domain-containing protein n=1 Tax=Nocardioides sp. Soil774 TaxID=1736408 RepID=UPI0006F4AEFC|nr:DUF3105 domain-containing protein [Nocardioides sp. Soil774]KRE96077.1 hypothetical protein ASG76_03250 [Nocardioides sp. Soil774]
MSDATPPDELAPAVEQPPAADAPREGGAKRLPLVLATVAAVLVMGAALAAPLVDRVIRGGETAQRVLDLSAVRTFDVPDRSHTTLDVLYPQSPPVGGSHAPIWLDCGVYDEPVRDENAVHDLEHGAVWITHDPDLAADDVEQLAAQLPDNGIMSPYAGLDAPVVVTVWGVQLGLDGPDDERLGLFLEEYGDGHTAPEFGVTCQGGTDDPQGALPEPGANA